MTSQTETEVSPESNSGETVYERLLRKVNENKVWGEKNPAKGTAVEKQITPGTSAEGTRQTQVELLEEGQTFSLMVDANNSLYHEGTESDPSDDESETGTEQEIMPAETETDSHYQTDEPNTSDKSGAIQNALVAEGTSTQQKLNEIDSEMIQHITELKDEMQRQGMHDAATMLQGCLEPNRGQGEQLRSKTDIPKRQPGLLRKKNADAVVIAQANKNSNSQVRQIVSEETIYDNAVEN